MTFSKKMKTLLIILTGLVISQGDTFAEDDHIAASRSPVLTVRGAGEEGSWIPRTYGGVTGVVLDLDQIGTDKMLSVFFNNANTPSPLYGKNFKLHSDTTTNLRDNTGLVRRVLLVSEKDAPKDSKLVICYKIYGNFDTLTDDGKQATSESTNYSLTITTIIDELEVLGVTRWAANFPQEEYAKLRKQVIENKSEMATPRKPSD